MILLYPSEETAFADNGLGALSDAISCTVTEARNGEFEAQLEYPLTGIHYGELAARRILTVKPNPTADPQPFRIYRITRPLSGKVTVYARHISYDLSGVTVAPFTASSAAGAFAAIQQNATGNNAFSFWTDVTGTGNLSVAVPSSARSLLGGSEGSILDVFGGEYEFDSFTVRLRGRRGQDSGVSIRYGKNLTSLEQDENIAGVATGVYPFWAGEDGALVTLPEKTVDAPGTYDFAYVIPLDLSGEFEEAPSVSQLRERAQRYVEDNDIGVPSVSLSVAFQPLEQTEEYKDIALLEKVNLCDTVTVEYPALGVSATAKCVKTVYDALKDRYTAIELGDAKANFVDTVLQQEKKIEKVPTTSYIQQAVLNATNLITGNKGGYVVLHDSTGDGEPDEILIMDRPDIAAARKVWRWNSGGLGYSSTGYNGPYGTAMTQDGAIVADFITAGILNAGIIKSGRIAGQSNPNVYFDLDSGEIRVASENMRIILNSILGFAIQMKENDRWVTKSWLDDNGLVVGKLSNQYSSSTYAEIGSAGSGIGLRISSTGESGWFGVYKLASGGFQIFNLELPVMMCDPNYSRFGYTTGSGKGAVVCGDWGVSFDLDGQEYGKTEDVAIGGTTLHFYHGVYTGHTGG